MGALNVFLYYIVFLLNDKEATEQPVFLLQFCLS